MPGGFGGLDLYYSDKEGSNWGPAMNMGPEVNTEGREYFPTVAPDGRIYFASDGLIGLGGLDIFYVEKRDGDVFTTPENLGFPINNISDDFGITFNEAGTCGFFSSDRAGGVGRDDIYSFKKVASPIEVLVIDESTKLPIEGATVQLLCKSETLTTDADGLVRFDMKMGQCCNLVADFEDYDENTAQTCTKNITLGDKVMVEIPLKRQAKYELAGTVFDDGDGLPLEGAKVTLEKGGMVVDSFFTEPNGRFAFELEEGVCYNKLKAVKGGYLSDKKEEICTVDLTESTGFNENLHLQPTAISFNGDTPQVPADGKGSNYYNNKNEEGEEIENSNPNETEYAYSDLTSGGAWTDKATGLPADGEYPDGTVFEKGILVEGKGDFNTSPFTTEEEIQSGTITVGYLVHIYYDFDESYIRDDAEPELMKLYDMMNENPDYIVEIGSHTDARGSGRYNLRLSQQRAESVVNWLIDKGISNDRLVPRGYGEKQNVNKCANYIPCSEADHQMNRRTEFKVVGCLTCVDPAEEDISKPAEKSTVRVDECDNCPF
jgi:outer membrane protein OmpA-like peptidoglycan-associated protein